MMILMWCCVTPSDDFDVVYRYIRTAELICPQAPRIACATVKGKGARYKGGRRHLVRLERCAKGGWMESLVRFAAAVKWIRVQGWCSCQPIFE
ncbi:hypothetical protein CEXT_377981 [Caerostris extrusa]|uniref:Secreted protein n=1 Tax=Caerostris extrusa TaxID=172846 RepID=A0AAV4WUQ1_CAEEX|nr:hypothetical protein CEXT_377981 [Caerostris extrusa]